MAMGSAAITNPRTVAAERRVTAAAEINIVFVDRVVAFAARRAVPGF